MSLPKTYKACVIEGAGKPFDIKELELQHPKEGEVLVKVKACGVCHTDVAAQEGHLGPMVNWPLVPGHELVGDVVEVGAGVKKWKVGDRVGGPWHGGHDGMCRQCNLGFFQTCEAKDINGVTKSGGWAEYCILRAEAAVRIPKSADPIKVAPLLCAGVTVFNAMRRQKVQAGDTVVIQGLGGLGHLALQYARRMGFYVVAVSSSDAKRDFAMKLGAHHYIDTSKESANEALDKIGGANMVVITAPNPKIMGGFTAALKPGGTLLILAPAGEVPINTGDLIMKGVNVTGWPSGHAQDSEDAIEFATNQGIECMTEPFPFSKLTEAVEHMTSGKVRFRGVLTFD